MKMILKDNERAYLFKNGVYKRLLGPGKVAVRKIFGESAVKVTAEGRVVTQGISLPVLLQDAAFEKCVKFIEIPDDHLAVHFVDGRISEVISPGAYAFWNILNQNTFELVDITDPESAGRLPMLYISRMPSNLCVRYDINEGEAGLLLYNGVYQRTLPPGTYFFWTYNTKIAVPKVETRVQQMDITGQEILTADKVSLRVNFVCSFQVVDPVSAVTKIREYREQLHVMTQLVLREFAGKFRFDELLRQKDSIGGFVLKRLKERESEFYVSFKDAGVKDIVLPGDIKDIMNTVLIAEKRAQASVITRREETAATRSLLDTAKLMDENGTLFKLKELEYLERICDKVGTISVGSGDGILASLRELVSGKK
jgi:regulator of protease activity HflC (stomatin/prohibitin superfamily)